MYRPPEKKIWKGRIDKIDGQEGNRWHQSIVLADLAKPQLPKLKSAQKGFALLGFRSDEGVRRNHGRVGAIEGSSAIRGALANVPYHLATQDLLVDAGDVFCLGKFLEDAQEELGRNVEYLLERRYTSIVLGGGHELAFGSYQGIHKFARRHQKRVGIINFDAHFDLRHFEEVGNSGTSFLQIAQLCEKDKVLFNYLALGIQRESNTPRLFQTAQNLGASYLLAEELQTAPQEAWSKIAAFVEAQDILYLSVCLDVFGAAYAPGVSALNPLGLAPQDLLPLLKKLAATGKVVHLDIAELNPRYDIDQRSAKLAASLIFHFIDAQSTSQY